MVLKVKILMINMISLVDLAMAPAALLIPQDVWGKVAWLKDAALTASERHHHDLSRLIIFNLGIGVWKS